MNRLLVSLGVLLLLLSGCEGSKQEQDFVPKEQQNAMTRLTVAAGYEVAGIPQYDGTQWTANVRIQGCKTNITVAGDKAAESKNPTSFTVLRVGETPLSDLSPGIDTTNISATALRALPGIADKLDCK